MSLIALNKNNERIISYADFDKGLDPFTCEACLEEMIFIDAKKKIKHFRHITKCKYENEPESEFHLQGKKAIAECFLNSILEHRVGNRIVDVVFSNFFSKYSVAIEFQCSPISLDELYNRTKEHYNFGYKTCWIFGRKDWVNFKTIRVKKEEFFINKYSNLCSFDGSKFVEWELRGGETFIPENDFGGGYWKKLKQTRDLWQVYSNNRIFGFNEHNHIGLQLLSPILY